MGLAVFGIFCSFLIVLAILMFRTKTPEETAKIEEEKTKRLALRLGSGH